MEIIERSNISNSIGNILTINQGKEFLAQLNILKEALIAADRFRDESIKFAKLECDALVKIAELGGIEKIVGKGSRDRKRAARWLYSLIDEEREKYINMCEDGLTIENVYWREYGEKEQLDKGVENFRVIKQEAIESYEKDGILEFSEYSNWMREKLPYDIVDPLIDGVRNDLRKKGAVSDGNGFYINPKLEQEKAKNAIQLRVRSIKGDIDSIKSICSCLEKKPTFEISEHGEYNDLYIALGMSGFIEASAKNDMALNKFVDLFFNMLGTSFSEYSSKIYDNDKSAANLIGDILYGSNAM